jgi:hypothetical protein
MFVPPICGFDLNPIGAAQGNCRGRAMVRQMAGFDNAQGPAFAGHAPLICARTGPTAVAHTPLRPATLCDEDVVPAAREIRIDLKKIPKPLGEEL